MTQSVTGSSETGSDDALEAKREEMILDLLVRYGSTVRLGLKRCHQEGAAPDVRFPNYEPGLFADQFTSEEENELTRLIDEQNTGRPNACERLARIGQLFKLDRSNGPAAHFVREVVEAAIAAEPNEFWQDVDIRHVEERFIPGETPSEATSRLFEFFIATPADWTSDQIHAVCESGKLLAERNGVPNASFHLNEDFTSSVSAKETEQ